MIIPLRTGYFVLLLTTATWLTSCSKDDKPAPRTRTELLTGPQWRLTGFVTTGTLNGTVTTTVEAIDPCEQDDLLQFSVTPSAQTFVIDQGPLVCGYYAGHSGRWELASEETILRYNSGTSYQTDEKILTLTDTQLVTIYHSRNSVINPYSQTRTYTAR